MLTINAPPSSPIQGAAERSDGQVQFDINELIGTPLQNNEVAVNSSWEAKRRAEERFVESAVKAIRSGRRGLGPCYFRIAELHRLEIPLGWAILNYDISADPQICKKFTHGLVFLGLNLLQIYNTPPALELLSKGRDQLLQVFTDQSKTRLRRPRCDEVQLISLFRCLLECSGGREDFSQHKFDQERTANENANLCGSLIGITGSNCFGNFDTQKMLNALSSSKVFTDDDFRTLNVVELSIRMMAFLPIGYPQGHLDLPAQVLHRLSTGYVNEIGIYITHFYHLQPSLCIPANNVLLLLAWNSTVEGSPLRVLSKWAASDDGLSFYKRSVRDIQNSHTTEQLALTLAALLCHKRLLPSSPTDCTQSNRGSYLADFDALIKGELLTNKQVVFERMLFSLLRVLETFTDGFKNIRELLATVVKTSMPILHHFDGFSDQYWLHRMSRLTHENAFGRTNIHYLMEHYVVEATVVLEGDEWMMVDSLK